MLLETEIESVSSPCLASDPASSLIYAVQHIDEGKMMMLTAKSLMVLCAGDGCWAGKLILYACISLNLLTLALTVVTTLWISAYL